MVTNRDYYEILGLSKGATDADLKAAYRKMALQYHPDRNKDKDAEVKFKEVNEAYQVLSDSQKKQQYDQFGHAAFDPRSGGSPGGFSQSGPFSWSYTSGGGSPFGGQAGAGGDFNDPFDMGVDISLGRNILKLNAKYKSLAV